MSDGGVNQEITKFLQGYIDNEVNLNAEGTCTLTCNDYQNTRHHECRPDTLCAALQPHHRNAVSCKGKVRGCYTLEDELSVCPSVGVENKTRANSLSFDPLVTGHAGQSIQVREVDRRAEARQQHRILC